MVSEAYTEAASLMPVDEVLILMLFDPLPIKEMAYEALYLSEPVFVTEVDNILASAGLRVLLVFCDDDLLFKLFLIS